MSINTFEALDKEIQFLCILFYLLYFYYYLLLYLLLLKIFFIFVKNNSKVKGLNIFNHEFLYIVYADDTTFFLKNRKSIIELMSELNTFSNFSGLKPNKAKCEIAGISVLNGV